MIKTALALFLTRSLFLSFNYRETSPVSQFPHYTAASDDTPFGNLSNPAYLSLWKSAYINIDYAKPYTMDEIDSGNFRVGYGFERIGIQAGWSRFGIDEYREDIFSGNIGYKPFNFLSAGLGVSYYTLTIDTEDLFFQTGLTDLSLSLLLLPFDWFNMSYTHENIYSVLHKNREDLLYPNWSFGISLKPAAGINFVWNINSLYYDYVNTFAISANLLSSLCIKAGYSRETSSYAGTFIFMYGNFSVSYGINHHPYLGQTHKLGLTITDEKIALQQVSYYKKLYRSSLPEIKKKLNINNCTLSELKEAEIVPELIAERIINYRTIIGPITQKGLLQIGLSQKEITQIKSFIKGLAAESEKTSWKDNKSKRKTYKGIYTLDQRKRLFQSLLKNGFGASSALRITEVAKNKSWNDLILEVKRFTDVTPEKKRLIIKICSEIL